jgi:antirestriction protein ArdC
LINSQGSHAGNNAQQIASLFSRSPQAGRAKNLPSHYDLLLIIGRAGQRQALHLSAAAHAQRAVTYLHELQPKSAEISEAA